MKTTITAAGRLEIEPENTTEEFALRMFVRHATDTATKNWMPGAVVIVFPAAPDVPNAPRGFAPTAVRPHWSPK